MRRLNIVVPLSLKLPINQPLAPATVHFLFKSEFNCLITAATTKNIHLANHAASNHITLFKLHLHASATDHAIRVSSKARK